MLQMLQSHLDKKKVAKVYRRQRLVDAEEALTERLQAVRSQLRTFYATEHIQSRIWRMLTNIPSRDLNELLDEEATITTSLHQVQIELLKCSVDMQLTP
jgi:hypothetical protein